MSPNPIAVVKVRCNHRGMGVVVPFQVVKEGVRAAASRIVLPRIGCRSLGQQVLCPTQPIRRARLADDLVFPARSGEKKDENKQQKPSGRKLDPAKPLDPANLVHYHFQPALEAAGLRRFRFHDLRHTYGSLLAQAGAPLVYIKEQMGHSSIRITADCYAHLQPAANIGFADMLDRAPTPQPSATQAQTDSAGEDLELQDDGDVIDLTEIPGGPGRIRTCNQQIMRPFQATENKENQQLKSAKHGQVRTNPQTGRKRGEGEV